MLDGQETIGAAVANFHCREIADRLLPSPGNVLTVSSPAAGPPEVPVQASVPQRVKDQQHQVVPGQQPGFRYQAISSVDALLITSWMHQPVTDLGHHVRTVQGSALTLALVCRELGNDREQTRVDVDGDLGRGQNLA